MAQIVVYGLASVLKTRIRELSDAIHAAAKEAFELPDEKRFHRFIPLDRDCFIVPPSRSDDYTIVEVSMFEGRSVEAKKRFIFRLYETTAELGIAPDDLEITITETPRSNWGIRGLPADELSLDYRVEV
jgi:phenylpyruvate tautomerase PptA (4-oxalocrotonate tautomerase family)